MATDSLTWDWPWIQKLFKDPSAWPVNLERRPLLLTSKYLVEFDDFAEAVERAFAAGLRQHHSLDDAKANRLGWIAAHRDIDQDARKGNLRSLC